MVGSGKPLRLLSFLLVLLILNGFIFVGCAANLNSPVDILQYDEQNSKDVDYIYEDKESKNIIFAYLSDEYMKQDVRVYFIEDALDTPMEGDYRIDNVMFAGEKSTNEIIGVAFEINYSRYYFVRNEKLEKTYGWHKYEPYYIVLSRSGNDDAWGDVIGQTDIIDQSKEIGEIILEVIHNLEDIEASLSLDGYPQLVGPFSDLSFFNAKSESKILEGWEPVYRDGDYWIQYCYDGLTAICYYESEKMQSKIIKIETNRTDVSTYKGIRVGATRNEVLKVYPSIYDKNYWDYHGDYLWYCNNEDGFGSALLFWFENDVVIKIEVNNAFD